MKKFLRIILEIIVEAIKSISLFIANNLRNFANMLVLIAPYLMLFVGQAVYKERGYISAGNELFIPILFLIVIYIIKSFANKIGKGITIPVPSKRFTEVDEDGEVNIRHDRLQELILYIADLEDWLEKKGLL
jgi:hypothetical protein